MSEVATSRSWQGRGKGPGGESAPQEPPRIRIDVAMGTPHHDIRESVFRQAWQLAGSQLRAAMALGLAPDTLSQFLRRCDRARFACPKVPEAWPMVPPPEPPPGINRVTGRSQDRAIGSSPHAAIDRKNTPSVAPIPVSAYAETDSPSDSDDGAEQNES